ncbi:MAG: hypothetical protein MJ168_06440 [Clostridia bacterium]|nr:hypothetical protein [Clostridia bacterium]
MNKNKKQIIIIAVAACVVIAGIIFGVIFANRNTKVPGKKNESDIAKSPEAIEIIDEKDKTTVADVTAITAGVDGKGNVVDSKGIVDVSGHKIYATGEKNNSGETIYTTGKKASNGLVLYTLNKKDSLGQQIYYTGIYKDGKLQLTNTAEKPDYTTNDTPKKHNNTPATTSTTVGYKGTSKLEITGAKYEYFKYFGGSGVDTFRSVNECKDGGYVAVCLSQSYNGDFDGTSKDWGVHSAVVKYDAAGKQSWKYITGGDGMIALEEAVELKDGSVVAVGSTSATDTQAPLNSKLTSSIIIRLDKNGKLIWMYSFPGDKEQEGDFASSVAAAPDGGFVVGGKAVTTGGFFAGENKNKAYLFKFDKNCNLKWRRTLTGSMSNTFEAVSVADNGDIYATCVTTSSDGDFSALVKGKSPTSKNTVLVKLDKGGDLKWSKNLDGSGNSDFKAVCATSDGGCVVAGSYTLAGRADGIYNISYGKSDGFVIRYDSKGNVCWARNFGGSQNDYIFDITEVNGGFALTGNTQSVDYNFQGCGNSGEQDAFVIYINESGEFSCAEMLDGKGADEGLGICTLTDGNVVIAGTSKSADGAFTGSGAGGQFKAFVAKYKATTKDASKK